MKPFSRTVILASALSSGLAALKVDPWNNFMISAILFVGILRLTGALPGNLPSITACIGTGVVIGLTQIGVRPLYAFIAGGLLTFPTIIALLYRYLGSGDEFPADEEE